MLRHPRCAFALGLLMLGAAACGGDGEATTTASATASSTTTTTAEATTSTSGTGGAGGGTSSAGGGGATSGEGGAGGEGGSSSCTPVTLGEALLVDADPTASSIAYDLLGLDASKEHVLYLEFFDIAGAQTTGSFDLGAAPDDNYETCAHCLIAFEDVNGAAPTVFYPAKGTLHVTTADTLYTGASAGTFEGVELVEVTLDETITTPVPGGRCLSLGGGWDHTGG